MHDYPPMGRRSSNRCRLAGQWYPFCSPRTGFGNWRTDRRPENGRVVRMAQIKLPILLCGACCLHMTTPPFVESDYEDLPNELMLEISQWLDFINTLGDVWVPCIWLTKNNQCKHRPQVCREFREGSRSCREAQMRYNREPMQLTVRRSNQIIR